MVDTFQPEWLSIAMRDAGIETGRLAELSGVSRSQIQRIRNGMCPRLSTFIALQNALRPMLSANKRKKAA